MIVAAALISACWTGCGTPVPDDQAHQTTDAIPYDQEWEPELEVADETQDPPNRPVWASQCPNVVLIILDTVRADKLGCYGCPHDTSPALDLLAAQGVQFDNVLAQCSWTRPSIGSLLTSQYPRTLGLYKEGKEMLPGHFEMLSEVLHAHGYYTIGLTANPNINASANFDQGFDVYVNSDADCGRRARFTQPEQPGYKALLSAAELFGEALRRIAAAPPELPIYLQVNIMEAHEWSVRDPARDMMEPEYASMFRNVRGGPFVKYLRMIRQATDRLGEFVARVTALPGWEDALFVFVSDHGEGLNDHPAVEISHWHGRLLYESNLAVPWIIYRPGWLPPRPRIQQEVRLLEVMPTILDYLGIPAPALMQGVSVLPWINGILQPLPIPEMKISESYFRDSDKIAVYGRNWSYVLSLKPHQGIAPVELQGRGPSFVNGALTSQLYKQPQVARILREYLESWEKEHPKAAPILTDRTESPADLDQLEAMGYLE